MFGITGDTPSLKQACSYFTLTEKKCETWDQAMDL